MLCLLHGVNGFSSQESASKSTWEIGEPVGEGGELLSLQPFPARQEVCGRLYIASHTKSFEGSAQSWFSFRSRGGLFLFVSH